MVSNNIEVLVAYDILDQKLTDFLNDEQINDVSEEDREKIINCLLRGDMRDLGGLIALRGFVYQYFVAIYYMVEMIYSEEAWWEEVIFEFLDDITLYGTGKIRFVQVKTVREDGKSRNLTNTRITKRDNGQMNSWLDKLFLNLADYRVRHKEIEHSLGLQQEMDYQFELVTNTTYDDKLAPFAENYEFDLVDKSTKKDITTQLEKIIEKKGDKGNIIESYSFQDKVGESVGWCLDRFMFNHIGRFDQVRYQIIHKLVDITDSKKSYISEMILDELLKEIVKRTHRDDLPDKRMLIFTEQEVRGMIKDFEQKVENQVYEDMRNKVTKGKFDKLFGDLRNDIEEEWNSLRGEMIDSLTLIQEALLQEFDEEGDGYVYERFLNRLFDMNDSNGIIPIEGTKEQGFVLNSLKFITLYLAMYKDRSLQLSNSKLLFKKGRDDEREWINFAIYHARKKETFDLSVSRVRTNTIDCPYSISVSHRYHCFIAESKGKHPHHMTIQESSIAKPDFEGSNINSASVKIICHSTDILDEWWDEMMEEKTIVSFSDPEIKGKWELKLSGD